MEYKVSNQEWENTVFHTYFWNLVIVKFQPRWNGLEDPERPELSEKLNRHKEEICHLNSYPCIKESEFLI